MTVSEIMLDFAERTGLSPADADPERYLWTDAFAVCNFFGLYAHTRQEHYRRLALELVSQVHEVLGRHRRDDRRTGWISGLSEEEGRKHPTAGGLRIGKKLNERKSSEPFDEQLEWDRDGQYFHYLTQWMHALDSASRATGNPTFNRWAIELAKAVHAAFVREPRKGAGKRLFWKMSIDLSYPLVSSMGHHDPLDGLITYHELQTTSGKLAGQSSPRDLAGEISDLAAICADRDWVTDDPLGIGGLLTGAFRMARSGLSEGSLFEKVLQDSLASLQVFDSRSLRLPADYRLAFRELGLSIGLQAAAKLKELAGERPDAFRKSSAASVLRGFGKYPELTGTINAFWLEEKNRRSALWREHYNINMVMLATSLSPDGYLSFP